MAYTIMIIEDDPVLQEELGYLFRDNGYTVDTVTGFSDVIAEVKERPPHLILLDINLPGQNGYAVCTGIRKFSRVPVIFVTSRDTDMDELNSIMTGGDAFITKPYNVPILLAKAASLLKRSYAADYTESCEYKGAVLHLDRSEIEFNQARADLTKNELKILSYLFKRAGRICPRADIIEFLWDHQLYVDDNALSVNITRIRDKLAYIGLHDFIKTKHRQGYML